MEGFGTPEEKATGKLKTSECSAAYMYSSHGFIFPEGNTKQFVFITGKLPGESLTFEISTVISGGGNLLLVTQEWAFVGDRRLLWTGRLLISL